MRLYSGPPSATLPGSYLGQVGEGPVCAQAQGKGTLGGGCRSWAGPALPRCWRVRHGLQHGVGIGVLRGIAPHAPYTLCPGPLVHTPPCGCLVCAWGAGTPAGSLGVGGSAPLLGAVLGVRGGPLWTEGALFPRPVGELGSALTKSHLCLGDAPPACRNRPPPSWGLSLSAPLTQQAQTATSLPPSPGSPVLGRLNPRLLLGGPRGLSAASCCQPVQARGHFHAWAPQEHSLTGSSCLAGVLLVLPGLGQPAPTPTPVPWGRRVLPSPHGPLPAPHVLQLWPRARGAPALHLPPQCVKSLLEPLPAGPSAILLAAGQDPSWKQVIQSSLSSVSAIESGHPLAPENEF